MPELTIEKVDNIKKDLTRMITHIARLNNVYNDDVINIIKLSYP